MIVKIKKVLIIILIISSGLFIRALVDNSAERRKRIIESFIEKEEKEWDVDAKLQEQFFPIGKFYITIPNTNINHDLSTEGPAKAPLIIHHNFQSMSDTQEIGLVVTYSIFNTELDNKKRKDILDAIYNDLSNRHVDYGKLLYKNDLSFKGFPGKVMTPTQSIGNSISNSFRLSDS